MLFYLLPELLVDLFDLYRPPRFLWCCQHVHTCLLHQRSPSAKPSLAAESSMTKAACGTGANERRKPIASVAPVAPVVPVVPVKLKEREKGKGMGKGMGKGSAGTSLSAENTERKCGPPCLLDVEDLRQDGGQEASAGEKDSSVRVEEPDCLPSPRSARVSLQGMFSPPKVT